MSECQSFDPVADTDSRLLILGSMPGIRSLQMQQYYGHPQNRFWPLVTMLLGYAEVPLDYADKKQMLLDNRIALWDDWVTANVKAVLIRILPASSLTIWPDFCRIIRRYILSAVMEAKLPPPLKNIPDSSICRGLLCISCLLPARPMPAGA